MNVLNLEQELVGVAGCVGQELAVGGTAVSPAALGTQVTHCVVNVKTGAVRVTFDGTDPDATVGTYLPAGTVLWLSKEAATAAKFHQVDAAATVYASPFTN